MLVPPWSAAFPKPSGDAALGEALSVCDFVVAAGASAATWLLRYPPEHHPGNEEAVSLVLAILASLVVIGAICAGCGITTCGP